MKVTAGSWNDQSISFILSHCATTSYREALRGNDCESSSFTWGIMFQRQTQDVDLEQDYERLDELRVTRAEDKLRKQRFMWRRSTLQRSSSERNGMTKTQNYGKLQNQQQNWKRSVKLSVKRWYSSISTPDSVVPVKYAFHSYLTLFGLHLRLRFLRFVELLEILISRKISYSSKVMQVVKE